MKTTSYVSMIVAAALAAPVFAQEQAPAPAPAAPAAPAAAATRPAVEVLGDWVKLMQTVENLLKATTDGSSAAKAATDLQQLKTLQEKLNEELKLAQNSDQANLPQEELVKIFQKLQELQNVANSLNTEVERIEKAGFFGNDVLKGLLSSDAPVEVEEDETVVEEAPCLLRLLPK